jgi:hypothetical protein
MQQDIIFFDKKGFIPSRDTMTIDDYLRESETKLAILERVARDPRQVVVEQYHLDTSVRAIKVNPETAQRFYDRFHTEPYVGIVASPEEYARILAKRDGKNPTVVEKVILLQEILGKPLHLEEQKIRLWVPFVNETQKSLQLDLESTACHETVHCVINQFSEKNSWIQAEEAIAYGFKDNFSYTYAFRMIPILRAYDVFVPIAAISVLIGGLFAVESCSHDPVYAINRFAYGATSSFSSLGLYYYAYALYECERTRRFFKRCEQQGINPYYVFLRSLPDEFSSKTPIMGQLEKAKDNLRFQIMYQRLQNP